MHSSQYPRPSTVIGFFPHVISASFSPSEGGFVSLSATEVVNTVDATAPSRSSNFQLIRHSAARGIVHSSQYGQLYPHPSTGQVFPRDSCVCFSN